MTLWALSRHETMKDAWNLLDHAKRLGVLFVECKLLFTDREVTKAERTHENEALWQELEGATVKSLI